MAKPDLLARWRALNLREAVEVIDAALTTTLALEDGEARLATVTQDLARTQAILNDIRATAERENKERKDRIAAARASIEQAEADARERVQAIERDHAERVTALRQQEAATLAEIRRQAEVDVATVREELAAERRLLSDITAKVEEARREIAPFMARG